MTKKMKDQNEKVSKWPKTTVRIKKVNLIRIIALENNETLNKYINRVIQQDILRNGNEDLIKKYFKEK